MTLGKTIKQLRKETFLSQEQLAAKLDITAQAVSKWENEESYPDILFLPKIAAIFGVKIDELFDYNEESAYQQIENMLDHERYFTHADFSKSENFLLQQLSINPNDLHALTLLGDLYHTYAIKLDEKAASYTKQALALNPDDKSLHNTFHNAMHGGRLDWNVANHSELIQYYQNFIQEHPTITRAYLYLLDNLIDDDRLDEAKKVLENVDMVLLDIKHINPMKYKILTSVSLDHTLKFAEYLSSINKPVWVRYVLVPGYSDNEEDLHEWAKFVSQFGNIERVDILPFHQMGTYKWEKLGKEYKLKDVETPTREEVEKAEEIFKSYGLKLLEK